MRQHRRRHEGKCPAVPGQAEMMAVASAMASVTEVQREEHGGRLKFRHMYGRRTVRHYPRFAQGEADEPQDEDCP